MRAEDNNEGVVNESTIYLIQLFDYNCPSCTSGVTNVFVDDIDEFAENYSHAEENKDRVDKLMRSKSGEILTDYYSDDPKLNIVQKITIEDYGIKTVQQSECSVDLKNGYGWDSKYFFSKLVFEIRYIKWDNKIYKLMRPRAKGCCRKSLFDDANMWHKVYVEGNRFWTYQEEKDIPYQSFPKEFYNDVTLESFVWQLTDSFETEQEMTADRSLAWPTNDQIIRAMADLPGDAG